MAKKCSGLTQPVSAFFYPVAFIKLHLGLAVFAPRTRCREVVFPNWSSVVDLRTPCQEAAELRYHVAPLINTIAFVQLFLYAKTMIAQWMPRFSPCYLHGRNFRLHRASGLPLSVKSMCHIFVKIAPGNLPFAPSDSIVHFEIKFPRTYLINYSKI